MTTTFTISTIAQASVCNGEILSERPAWISTRTDRTIRVTLPEEDAGALAGIIERYRGVIQGDSI